jgi:hypothetical protein
METIMKYYEFKESLKRKAQNLKEIKIGLKEKQRTLFFNSFDMEGEHHGYVGYYNKHKFTAEQLRRYKLAHEDYVKCLRSHSKAYPDYRARHIAYSLFRGRTPEQIESNYYDGKWSEYNVEYDSKNKMWITLQTLIDKHLKQLEVDNPPETYYNRFDDEGNFIKEAV